jgi:hypothetical protein
LNPFGGLEVKLQVMLTTVLDGVFGRFITKERDPDTQNWMCPRVDLKDVKLLALLTWALNGNE